MSENGEIYTTGKKFYTPAGTDGMDKFHLWSAECGVDQDRDQICLRPALRPLEGLHSDKESNLTQRRESLLLPGKTNINSI